MNDEAVADDSWGDALEGAIREALRGDSSGGSTEREASPFRPAAFALRERPAGAALLASVDREGRYESGPEIGRGGMGIVSAGHDLLLDRQVAVKRLRDEAEASGERVRRFVEEARITGGLQHPGIVPVHDCGLDAAGRPFLTMKLVSGTTLKAELAARPELTAGIERLLRVFLQICEAVGYAHSHGVVHRDLKPSNVMLGAHGEVHVLDWGLATRVPDPGDRRPDGPARPEPIVGTPAYMAPEQARGDPGAVGFPADVFSLGAVLCEILTGLPPYAEAESGGASKDHAANADPLARAATRLDAAPADEGIKALARACLSPDPSARPKDAGELARLVAGHLASVGERAVHARIEAAESRSAAEHERRVRRLTTRWSAAVILVVVAAALAWAHAADARAREQRRLAGLVADGLDRARQLGAEALRRPEPDAALLAEALAAAEDARRLAGSDSAPEDLRDRARRLASELRSELAAARTDSEQRERDGRMAARLDEIRSARALHLDGRRADAEYAEAFRAYGIDVDALDEAEGAARLGRSAIAGALATGLDWWSLDRRQLAADPAGAARLGRLSIALTADPAVRALREATHARAIERLRGLLDEADLGALPPAVSIIAVEILARAEGAEHALRDYGRLVRLHPSDLWVQFGYGNWLDHARPPRRAEAIAAFSAALALAPENVAVKVQLADRLVETGLVQRALEVIDEAVAARPDLAVAHLVRGRVLEQTGDRAAAEAAFRAAIERDPRSTAAWNNLGLLFDRAGRGAEAGAAWEEAVRIDPRSSLGWANLASARLAAKDPARAEEAARTSLALDGSNAVSWRGLALAQLERGDAAGARASLGESLRLDPRAVESWVTLGTVHHRLGHVEEALAAFRRALEIDPSSAEAALDLGQLLWTRGRFEEALELIERGQVTGVAAARLGVDPEEVLERGRKLQESEHALQRVLLGITRPGSAAAWSEALRACRVKQARVQEAMVYRAFAAADPDGFRPWKIPAARVALGAGLGEGLDAQLADAGARRRWRDQACRWLRDLESEWRASSSGPGAVQIAAHLDRLLADPAFAAARAGAPTALDPEEVEAWAALWADLRDLHSSLPR